MEQDGGHICKLTTSLVKIRSGIIYYVVINTPSLVIGKILIAKVLKWLKSEPISLVPTTHYVVGI